jgi:hypothetical protein
MVRKNQSHEFTVKAEDTFSELKTRSGIPVTADDCVATVYGKERQETELNEKTLDALEALERAAKPGPWNIMTSDLLLDVQNACFIASARKALPALLAAARERDQLREQLETCRRRKEGIRLELRAEIERLGQVIHEQKLVVAEQHRRREHAAKEAESLRAQVVRLQTGKAIESDYIDELKLARTERDSAIEALQYRATQHAQQVDDLEVENARLEDECTDAQADWQAEKERADRYLDALKIAACEDASKWDQGLLPGNILIGVVIFRITRSDDGALVAEEVL